MNTLTFIEPALVNPLTYDAYRNLVEELVEQQQTSGNEQTEQRIAFTKLNLQRMKRVEKQFTMLPELKQLLQQNQPEWKWHVLVESWCGDGVQLLPAIAGIVAEIPSIALTVLLRDENPGLMDTCLSNGSRAIPKLICVDAATGERLFTWGSRPKAIQEQVLQFKENNPTASHDELVQQVQLWYAKDRSQALQQDLLELVQQALANTAVEAEIA
ncbi:thioredoxin family protein [Pontibacter cellulosilyticus]|uniref:Thioredoxin family protein n=1 Tax=Pontibacter cellulosilyticus TaxID=1720253 RepID=A0A923NA74_9BACT|nr:thioredoxin family protein [Pontibacter cellulosilyticus]MBC5994514.1 thioredoxin family protein [Pontibacter cellulosilyticus]